MQELQHLQTRMRRQRGRMTAECGAVVESLTREIAASEATIVLLRDELMRQYYEVRAGRGPKEG